jgi:DNA-binding LytR/AlgR family response regulator
MGDTRGATDTVTRAKWRVWHGQSQRALPDLHIWSPGRRHGEVPAVVPTFRWRLAEFVRIYWSCVLNLDCLARVELDARDNRIAILTGGGRLPVSRAGYARLNALLGQG